MDDLLDALWYPGSAVGCIVIETAPGNGLEDFVAALKGWPDLKVLVFGPTQRSLGQATHKHRFERAYSLETVTHWLGGSLSGPRDGGATTP